MNRSHQFPLQAMCASVVPPTSKTKQHLPSSSTSNVSSESIRYAHFRLTLSSSHYLVLWFIIELELIHNCSLASSSELLLIEYGPAAPRLRFRLGRCLSFSDCVLRYPQATFHLIREASRTTPEAPAAWSKELAKQLASSF